MLSLRLVANFICHVSIYHRLDFLLKSSKAYYCKVCAVARRSSIRPPPAAPTERNFQALSTFTINLHQQSANQLQKELTEQFLEHHYFNEVNWFLKSAEVTSLRSENSKALSLIQLYDDRNSLFIKLNELKSEICNVQSKLSDNGKSSASVSNAFPAASSAASSTLTTAAVAGTNTSAAAAIGGMSTLTCKPVP